MSNFKYIKNKNINRLKWDNCVSSSINYRVYALSWYLDVVCENWDAIVFDEYEAVFPVIYKKFFFRKFVYHPLFCQQLGLFYKSSFISKINEDLISNFHEKILFKFFKKFSYCATSEFSRILGFDQNKVTKQNSNNRKFNNVIYSSNNNFLIDLDKNYEDLILKFNNNTKRNLNKSQQFQLKYIDNLEIDFFIKLFRTNSKIRKSIKNFFFFNNNYLIVEKLINISIEKKRGYLVGVLDPDNNLVSAAFFLNCHNRYTMLFNVTRPNSRHFHSMTFLINYFIKLNCKQKKFLDFEGSNIPGVKTFYAGFGGLNHQYYKVQKKFD
ncbi:MAG: hypothetical protein CMP68_04645 [Flavobacteriales bacterium]|nr:hypothetical protein [Flavobacteriales bacterium]|tara:strand:- start:26307 stop:27278 length:972 start_codon:yes stop_codon:yes gene_type:complete